MKLISLTLALFLAATATARAAVIDYEIDPAGIQFDGIRVTGTLSFDDVLEDTIAADLVLSGAGARDGSYSILSAAINGPSNLLVGKTGASFDPGPAGGIELMFDSSLADGGTISLGFVSLVDHSESTSGSNTSFFQSSSDPRGTISEIPAAVPLPAGLPLLLAGLGGLAMLHRRRTV